MQQNDPELWLSLFPKPDSHSHKYTRGKAVLLGGEHMTGATRLAAESCLRMGAGMCRVLAMGGSGVVYRSSLPAPVIVQDYPTLDAAPFKDDRCTAALLGPGAGAPIKELVTRVLKIKKPCVLDADALSGFQGKEGDLYALGHAACVLTPHEAEFQRIFPNMSGKREERARDAAQVSGCVVVLKGGRTVISAPDGRVVLNAHASPYLATAGTGDVLSGMITALLAQGMPAFEAACTAVWCHGQVSLTLGVGMIASDIPKQIPGVLKDLGL